MLQPKPKHGYECEEEKNDYGKVIKYKCCKYEEPVEEPEARCCPLLPCC